MASANESKVEALSYPGDGDQSSIALPDGPPDPLDTDAPVLGLIQSVVPDYEDWLGTPNPRLMGRKPSEMIAAGDEEPIRELLLSVIYVGVS